MEKPKRPLGILKKKAVADNTKVSKMVKDPNVGPNYSEFNKSQLLNAWPKAKEKLTSKDTADYKRGYQEGISNAKKGKIQLKDKQGNPVKVLYPYKLGFGENMRFAEGRFEGEKRGKKK
jgi:uncharacterized protein YdcH (DUF465 family)